MTKKLILEIDGKGDIVFESKLTSLPLKEEGIIQKSIEWFNDPEPCFIHRSAVMKRIFLEMDEFFDRQLDNGIHEILWEELPDNIRSVLDLRGEVKKIMIKTV